MVVTPGGVTVLEVPLLEDAKLLTFDEQGTIVSTSVLADAPGRANAMLQTEGGLVFAGSAATGDLWLARMATGVAPGTLETLMLEDFAGLDDRFVALAQYGDTIGALGQVGTSSFGSADAGGEVVASILVEFDAMGQELRRTVVSSPDPSVSFNAGDLAVSSNGTWIVAGSQSTPAAPTTDTRAWATAVEDGLIRWMVLSPDTVMGPGGRPFGLFHAAAARDSAMLVGRIGVPEGIGRLAMVVSVDDGSVTWEQLGPAIDGAPDAYQRAATLADGMGWFVGTTRHSDHVEQWLCSAQL